MCGDPERVQKKKEELKADPPTIQDFKVMMADNEKYLGAKIVSRTIADIIETNIKMKAGKDYQDASQC